MTPNPPKEHHRAWMDVIRTLAALATLTITLHVAGVIELW